MKKQSVCIPINGAEQKDLDARAAAATQSIPAYVRTVCGLQPWPARGVEMGQRQHAPSSRPVRQALERRTITVAFTPEEYAALDARDSIPNGRTIPQFVRTLLGFQVRYSSLPGTDERVREEDDAWDRLQVLGLNPEDYFPEDLPA